MMNSSVSSSDRLSAITTSTFGSAFHFSQWLQSCCFSPSVSFTATASIAFLIASSSICSMLSRARKRMFPPRITRFSLQTIGLICNIFGNVRILSTSFCICCGSMLRGLSWFSTRSCRLMFSILFFSIVFLLSFLSWFQFIKVPDDAVDMINSQQLGKEWLIGWLVVNDYVLTWQNAIAHYRWQVVRG